VGSLSITPFMRIAEERERDQKTVHYGNHERLFVIQ
jgi:hypothetical protein